MNTKGIIQTCTLEHLDRYAVIYAEAFSGEPWNDNWEVADAKIHVAELMESPQSFGLEYVVEGEVAGFILGTSMLFHYGRTFEINDLAVARSHQRRGIASTLLEAFMNEMKQRNIKAVHLITAGEGVLPQFYERFGFKKEDMVILMGKEI